MTPADRIVVTGTGAVCAAGATPEAILDAIRAGRSAIAPIRLWDTTGWPCRLAAEIPDFNPRAMVEDRKLHKLIRRTDLVGLYAAGKAIERSGIIEHRGTLDEGAAATYSDRTGVYAGSGGGNYENQYDYFPLLASAHGELPAFGRELSDTVNPMWLLRTLPNNVLGHIGIRHGLKGANACITNHSVGGTLAVIEALEALRTGEADRAVAVGHETPIEPQMVLYYQRLGLIASDMLYPFDVRHDGSLFGEGAGALVLETESSAKARNATVIGEVLGGGYACEAVGLAAIRDDGDGLVRAIGQALEDAGIDTADVGMVVAHANGTPQSDRSEAQALRTVFGAAMPPVTGFKWAIGHTIAAAGIIEAVIAFAALARNEVPGIANLAAIDPACAGVSAAAAARTPTSDIAVVLCRGFAGTAAALVIRGR
ncbi:MAG TPA: beta-ketoacyl synthase N-terminal-like domain-containing protein [Casimicrobiaceae bacterium]|nr:beta-ketoacyl synthase N-terminal-like domain-containing protein [Casimicrobiaceae bacterium]